MLRKDQIESQLDQLQIQVTRLKDNSINSAGKQIPPEMLIKDLERIENVIERIINLIELED
jgi:hypothetical protein|tara:strand:+ start:338 stop:520 length:183 start_codon:yes stop_codon:yes gene_type:complete